MNNAVHSHTTRLLDMVQARLRLNAAIQGLGRTLTAVASTAVVLILLLRLCGLHAVPVELWQWCAALTVVAVGTLLLWPQPPARAAARKADELLQTNDLFLTATDNNWIGAGDYANELQNRAAETAAANPGCKPALDWKLPLRNCLIAALVSSTVLHFTPQLDPFGFQQAQKEIVLARKTLSEQIKNTEQKRKQEDAANAALEQRTQQTLEDLLQTFQELRPETKEENAKRLRERQQELARQWKKVQQRKQGAPQDATRQRFGFQNELSKSIERALSQGDTKPLKDAIKKAQELAGNLKNATTPEEQRLAQQALEKQLQDLMEATKANPQLAKLAKDLDQAMQQCNQASVADLQKEAMQALEKSLQEAGMSAEDLQQAMNQMKQLEEAMQANQDAQQCNAQGCLGEGQNEGGQQAGQKGEGQGQPGFGQGGDAQSQTVKNNGGAAAQTLADYAKLYQQLLQQQQAGGGGMGGPGTGTGGVAPEKPDEEMDSQASRVQTGFDPNDVIMKWKIEGEAKEGTVERNYRHFLPETPQEVSEAIVQENIPAGYHEGIQGYFDNTKQAGENTQ